MKRTAIAAAVAELLAGTAQAASTEFILYKGQNFSGPSQVIKGEVANPSPARESLISLRLAEACEQSRRSGAPVKIEGN